MSEVKQREGRRAEAQSGQGPPQGVPHCNKLHII